MNFAEIKNLDENHILHSYGRLPVALKSGKGSSAVDADGKEYIDFTSGIGVNSLGFCPENWSKAIIEQCQTMQHMSNYFYSEKTSLLAKNLTEAAGLSRAFFCNSGAEANECAIKIARKNAKSEKAYKIITLLDSFHGRTITTLAATGQDVFHEKFLPLTDGFVYAKAGDVEAVKTLIDDEICGIMVECVQGEGGVVPMEDSYLQALRTICDENGLTFIVDEVQTGIGRTGYFYSYQSAGIIPDVVTSAKGLGGGLPIGVCMVSEPLKDIFGPSDNGSTFGGNPVVCAGALEVVATVNTPDFLSEVTKKGEYIKEKLLAMENVEFVRGKALMMGIAIKNKTAKEALLGCADAGLLILTAKDLVRFLPPLNISYEEIDKGLEIFESIIK